MYLKGTLKIIILACSLGLVACSSEEESSKFESAEPFANQKPTFTEASKFLYQASFGPTESSVQEVMKKGVEKWIEDQIALPATLHSPRLEELKEKMCMYVPFPGEVGEFSVSNPSEYVRKWGVVKYPRHQTWWEVSLRGQDQLRQRVAFALSQILVVSKNDFNLIKNNTGLTNYYDMLVQNAFGNYGELLKKVSMHPAMGVYLTHALNQKANPEKNTRADENYARELLQLFSVGVNEINLDGTPVRDSSGDPIASYDQNTIEEFAKIFTGWGFDIRGDNGSPIWGRFYGSLGMDVRRPMIPHERFHDTTEKTLLNNEIVSAGQTAEEDLNAAIDNIMRHPNVGPFISTLLIKRLAKSNPSPAYVARVATLFNDNGKGVKGDLAAVVKAILMDSEARDASYSSEKYPSGKLKSPMLRMANLWRAFPLTGGDGEGMVYQTNTLRSSCGMGKYKYFHLDAKLDLSDLDELTGQAPLASPSVFNFFSPTFSPQGELKQKGLSSPEYELVTENQLVNTTNIMINALYSPVTIPFEQREERDMGLAYMDISDVVAQADDSSALISYLDHKLLSGIMSSELQQVLNDYLRNTDFPTGVEGNLKKARDLISLIIVSPEYVVEG